MRVILAFAVLALVPLLPAASADGVDTAVTCSQLEFIEVTNGINTFRHTLDPTDLQNSLMNIEAILLACVGILSACATAFLASVSAAMLTFLAGGGLGTLLIDLGTAYIAYENC